MPVPDQHPSPIAEPVLQRRFKFFSPAQAKSNLFFLAPFGVSVPALRYIGAKHILEPGFRNQQLACAVMRTPAGIVAHNIAVVIVDHEAVRNAVDRILQQCVGSLGTAPCRDDLGDVACATARPEELAVIVEQGLAADRKKVFASGTTNDQVAELSECSVRLEIGLVLPPRFVAVGIDAGEFLSGLADNYIEEGPRLVASPQGFAGEEREAMVGPRFPDPITAELDNVAKSRFALVKSLGGPRQLLGVAVIPAGLNGKGTTKDGKANHRAKDADRDDGPLVVPHTRVAVQIPHGNAGSDDK